MNLQSNFAKKITSIFVRKDNENERLFGLGDEINSLERKRQKLCAALGNKVYQSKNKDDIIRDIEELKFLDDEIEEKQKKLKELDTNLNYTEENHEKIN